MAEFLHPIAEDRSLSSEEAALVRWLLEHGIPGTDAACFLPQLEQARVVSRCPCGCASIDFSIARKIPVSAAPLQILSDYVWEDATGAKFGVFVFAKEQLLAGMEVWSIDALQAANALPRIEWLKPIAGQIGCE